VEYNFQDIGLHISVPNNYVIQDEFPKPSLADATGKQVTDTAKLQELAADLLKALLVVSSPDNNNTASFSLAMQTAKTGDFEQYYNFSKDMQQLMGKQQMTNYDTTSAVLITGNIEVRKFMTHTVDANPVRCSGIYLAQLEKYFLVIKVDYTEKKFGEEIEKAILTVKRY
jgi:hypothetical protein